MVSGAWLALALGLACSSSTSAPAGEPAAATTEVTAAAGPVTVAQLKAVVDQGGGVVIDVRTPEEYAGGHVPGAQNIPVGELADRLAELDAHRSAPVYLICASGSRSARATALLDGAGFAQPINVQGGTRAWVEAGYPVD